LDGDDVAHVLLWFAVFVAFDVIKMVDAQPSVYRENRFSVDLRENPMFAGVKQGSNSLKINEAQGQVFLRIGRCVEIAENLLGLSLGIAPVVFYSGGCHRWKLGRLAVLGLPVARGEAELPAPGLNVLRWDEEILGREAVLTSEALDAVAA
jgi:hypothetical protein